MLSILFSADAVYIMDKVDKLCWRKIKLICLTFMFIIILRSNVFPNKNLTGLTKGQNTLVLLTFSLIKFKPKADTKQVLIKSTG